MTYSILPSNNSPLQHALARLTEEEIAAIDWRAIRRAKDPDLCEEKWLPWLAWERSIGDSEGWRFAETTEARRRLIKGYVEKHQLKGTPASIRRLFRDLGLGEVKIIEHAASLKWNGEAKFDGRHRFGGFAGDWAKYGVVLTRVISVKQAAIVQEFLEEIAPARCQLMYLDYRDHPLRWNGEAKFNGEYTFGAITKG